MTMNRICRGEGAHGFVTANRPDDKKVLDNLPHLVPDWTGRRHMYVEMIGFQSIEIFKIFGAGAGDHFIDMIIKIGNGGQSAFPCFIGQNVIGNNIIRTWLLDINIGESHGKQFINHTRRDFGVSSEKQRPSSAKIHIHRLPDNHSGF